MTSGGGYIRAIWTVAALTVAIGCAEAAYGYASGSKLLLKDGVEWGYGDPSHAPQPCRHHVVTRYATR
jgi:hypothetical protein